MAGTLIAALSATGAFTYPFVHELRHPGSIVVDKEGLKADIAKHSSALDQYRKDFYSELVDGHRGFQRGKQHSHYAVVSTWNDLVSTDSKDVTTLNSTNIMSYLAKLAEILNQMSPDKKIEFFCNIGLNETPTSQVWFRRSEVCVQASR